MQSRSAPPATQDDPDSQHRSGEKKFWARVGLDPFEIAATLWAAFVRKHGEPQTTSAPSRAKRRKPPRQSERPRPKQKIPSRPFQTGRKFPSNQGRVK